MASAPPNVDVEATLDQLIEAGAVDEADDGTLSTTPAFEDTRVVYHDTYAHMDEEGFHDTVADLFGIDRDDVAAHVETTELTRDELVAYLSIRSFLDESFPRGTLAVMADILVQIGPGTPVPPEVTELTDEDYETFLVDEPDAIVTVWKHGCDPCEQMKGDLDAILTNVPDGVAVAGVDGESVDSFRADYEVNAAPAVLLFRDGDLQETVTGRKSPKALADAFDSVY